MPAEMPGVELEEHLNTPTPALEDNHDTYDTEPTPEEQQNQAEEATANTDLDHLPPPIQPIPANPNEMAPPDNDQEDEIIAIDNIQPEEATPQIPIEIQDDESQHQDEEMNDLELGGTNDNNNEEITDQEDVTEEDSEPTGMRRSKRSTAGQRTSTPYHEEFGHMNVEQYIHMNIDLETEKATNVREYTTSEVEDYVIHVIITQYSLKAGMKIFEERGEKATMKKLKQLHDMQTFQPVDGNELSRQQRKDALASLMFLKEKRNGEVKGRACVDGRPQRETIRKEEAASPTAATESVTLSSVIDAHERRDVATLDIPGAFLHSDNDDKNVIMILKGLLGELMVKVAPQIYRKYLLANEKGEKILYVRMTKALYGMLKSALLFYKKLVSDLRSVGFEINPYDPCMANKKSYGKQMTVVWHVDDLKVSHVDPKRVTRFCDWIQSKYGSCSVNRGKVHEYLGIDLDFRTPGVVRMSMIPYIQKILDQFPEDLGASAPTPAADH